MTLNQLRYFVGVCKAGGVTAAAGELHISQPSVSASLRELEEEFGVKLFSRVGKKLHLTKEGEYLLGRCTPILQDCDRLALNMQDLGNNKNRIQIGVPPMIGASIYPQIYSHFTKNCPDIRTDIWEQNSRQSCKMVELDSLDIAITILAEVDKTLFKTLKLRTTEVCCCVKNDSELAKFKTISPKQLVGVPLVMFKEGTWHVDAVLQRFEQADIKPNVVASLGQLQTIMQFANRGLAATFLFKELVEEQPDLVAIGFDEPITVDIGLVWRRDRYLFNDAMRLINCAKALVENGEI